MKLCPIFNLSETLHAELIRPAQVAIGGNMQRAAYLGKAIVLTALKQHQRTALVAPPRSLQWEVDCINKSVNDTLEKIGPFIKENSKLILAVKEMDDSEFETEIENYETPIEFMIKSIIKLIA